VGWVSGDENYISEIGCNGCYWYDVKYFNQKISENFGENND